MLEDDRVLEMVGDDPEAVLRPETTMANELKRRERISKANKGNVPWNKGRRHSPETIEKIRRKTMERMEITRSSSENTRGGFVECWKIVTSHEDHAYRVQ